MNKLHQVLVKKIVLGLCLLGSFTYGQKHTKEYKETFSVGEETVVDINTSYADIEFDTWNKNQIVVEAIITLEGATEEEAEAYFGEDVIEILGNSKEIKIRTSGGRENFFISHDGPMPPIPPIAIDIPDMEPLFLDLHIPDLPDIPEIIMEMPMPPMPPMHFRNFDYEAYQRDGEAYLKEWTKEFEKSFDKEYQKELEDWGKEMEARVQEREAAREEMMREREDAREEIMREREDAMQEREEMRREAQEAREEAQEARQRAMEEQRKAAKEYHKSKHQVTIYKDGKETPNVFYGTSDGEKRNYKIKKVIRVKMPKSAKLKMNVRHGEVKLAENTNNINATLSYARLLASTIDGPKTNIVASYSPVAVQYWNYGELSTNYSDRVDLKEVQSLTLNANSSEVTIERLTKSALITNDFGQLNINAIDGNFQDLTIRLKNGALECSLPADDFGIVVNGNDSTLKKPENLSLKNTKQGGEFSFKNNSSSSKTIVIDSKYSDIVLKK